MRKTKNLIICMLGILLAMTMAAGCQKQSSGGSSKETKDTKSTSEDTAKSTASAETNKASDQKITKISFYGNRTGEPSWEQMINETIKLHPELDVQVIDIDWANIDKILKTGIAAGTPPDVTHYWPMLIKPYVDAGQALDLTPYLEADNNEWKNTFPAELLELGNFNRKYYAVPYQSTFPTMYVNADIFKECGIEIPKEWNWKEFIDVCQTLKDKKDIAPFTVARDVNSWLNRLGAAGLAQDDGKLAEFTNGDLDFTQNYLPETMKNIKELYDKKLWYPGEGALNVTRDESKTAFVQGKAAIIAETNLIYPDLMGSVDFEVVPVLWPTMGKNTVIVGGTDGFMIPSNAAHPEEAISFIKTFLSPEIQKIRAQSSYPVAINGVEVTDPVVTELMKQTKYLVTSDYLNISAKVQEYGNAQLNANYILSSGDKALEDLEKLRLQSKEE
ncbi:ABC transporter substrate-binding protein [Robinsoniella peoriensis]|uniref:ABC transporter substrate-binding protein n=1 Tax=Robinsoniella peoriensis TaxID=180332 RepID=UPI00362D39F1